jgi:phage baseplate assembly protein W
MASRVIAGISWPFRRQGAGTPASAKGIEVVRSALIVLLRTPKRSRVFRPNLGLNLNVLLFEDTGPVMDSLLRREILQAIQNELPMISVLNIEINTLNKRVDINVSYSVMGIDDQTGFIELAA